MSTESATAPELLPFFPLPNAVLFPHTVLPLHVFETRYRRMVEEATAGNEKIVMALLRPGYEEDYYGRPAIHSVGTVGQITDLERLADGRFHLNLVGLHRVELIEIPTDDPFRVARALPRPERSVPEIDESTERAKLDLLAAHAFLMREITEDIGDNIAINDRVPFLAALNGACANLPAAPEVRQSLLELDDPMDRLRRARTLTNDILDKVIALRDDREERGSHCTVN